MSSITQEAVTESLNVAVDENGYRELIGMPAEEAAIDLINCNPDFEECEVDELLPFVKVWQDSRK